MSVASFVKNPRKLQYHQMNWGWREDTGNTSLQCVLLAIHMAVCWKKE